MASQQDNNGNVPGGAKSTHTRRPTAARVLPAIPLSLSRPRTNGGKAAARPGSGGKPQGAMAEQASIPGQGRDQGRGVAVSNGEQVAAPAQKQEAEEEQEGFVQGMAAAKSGLGEGDTHTPVSQGSVSMVVSHGSTPEPTLDQAPPQPMPLANGASAVNTHASTAGMLHSVPSAGLEATRQPVDRYDMRQIKTELPPAFVPAAGQHTPQSATSSQRQPPVPGLQYPSAGSIVFGGHDSSGSSPAPPPGLASGFAPPQPPPTQTPYYTHAHHASEPVNSRSYPVGPGQPSAPWSSRQGFVPPPHHANMAFRYPPRESFVPATSALANGNFTRSRSGSHASSAAFEGHRSVTELQSPIDYASSSGRPNFHDNKGSLSGPSRHGPNHFSHHMPPPPPPSFPHPELAAGFENAESMRDHVLAHFRNAELADCQLQVTDETNASQTIDSHRLVLSRSPRLLDVIRNNSVLASSGAQTLVNVQLSGRHVRVGPFIDCVRYLYGGPLPPFDLSNSGLNASGEERVQLALQCIATGTWLNIHAIAQRGVEIAASLLNWENISAVLAFALEGGLGHMWSIDYGSEERTSTCSSDDSFSKPEAGGLPLYDPHSSALLGRALEFTVHNLPVNFYLNSAAPQSIVCQRLPERAHHESKSSRSDPRLSKIRFGDMSTEDPSRPSPTTITISSILLSLPFPLLKYLLEHPALTHRLGSDTVSSIMRQVVQERETRRQKSLKAHISAHVDEPVEGAKVQNLYWEESVDPSHQHRAGFRLARRRRGIDTPSSSGTESEQNK